MKRACVFLILVIAWLSGLAQSLSWSEVKQQVLTQHPAARQADMLVDQAQAGVLRAKGGFDPKLYGEHSGKNFNGKNYFQFTETGVKWPSWAGLELKGSYNLANGVFLNPENSLPRNGQATFGFEWALAQGLLYDERRAGMDGAQADVAFNQAQRLALQNDLLLDVAKAYWSWVYAQNALQITQNALVQASIRHEGLRESFFQGDKPAIDTLETFIQLQSRQVDLQFAQIDAQNSSIALANFLWVNPKETVSPSVLPPAPNAAVVLQTRLWMEPLDNLIGLASSSHPELRMYQAKMSQLNVERKLKREKLKPVVNFNYNLLGDNWTFFPTASAEGPAVLANDMKWGVDISYPLLNRKARGDFQFTKIKIAQTEMALQQKLRDIETKVRQYGNDAANLRTQVNVFFQIAENYRLLLEGEMEKFRQGESSIFLINTREQRYLDAQLKYLKLLSELQKAEAGLLWAAGRLAG